MKRWLWCLSIVLVFTAGGAPNEAKAVTHVHGALHVPAHIAAFAVVSFLACLAEQRGHWPLWIGFAVSYVLERWETTLGHSPMEWNDVGWNALGVTLGAIFWWVARRRIAVQRLSSAVSEAEAGLK